jgi:hypothetical protein
MTSNATYTLDSTPYVYLIGWTSQNIWYYGARYGKRCHPTDLWTKYFTSSQYVKQFREQVGEPDVVEVRKTFHSPSQCVLWETRLLHKIDAKNNPQFLNNHNGGEEFRGRCGTASAFSGTRQAYDKVTGEYVGRLSTQDPRWSTGEIYDKYFDKNARAKKNRNTAAARDANTGQPLGRIPHTDPRWQTGEIATLQAGKPQVAHRKPVWINGEYFESIRAARVKWNFTSFPKIMMGVLKTGPKYGIHSFTFTGEVPVA